VAQNVGLADIVDRMSAAYPAVVGFADAIDAIDSLIAARLGPAQKFLDDAHVAGPKELVELLRMSATDPLSLTTGRVEHLIAVIDRGVEQLLSEAATLAALQDNWRDELDATAAQLDDLRNLTRQLFEVCTRAAQAVKVGPLPLHPNAEPGLRIELEAIVARSTSNPDPVALLALRQRIVTALRIAGDDERLAQGLLDRRGELKGRLAVYQAKAARLGLGEDRELLASGRIAAGLLSRRPCDLGAVTRAVKDFQQMIAHRQGAPS
jgi:hypothetical protein